MEQIRHSIFLPWLSAYVLPLSEQGYSLVDLCHRRQKEIISFPLSFELSIPSSTQIRFTPKSCILCKEFKTSAALRPNLESLNTSTNCTSSVPFSILSKHSLKLQVLALSALSRLTFIGILFFHYNFHVLKFRSISSSLLLSLSSTVAIFL